jgi:Lecithin retinol acyltransferase
MSSQGTMQKAIISCVNCAQKLRVPVDRGLLEITCPTCDASWQWDYSSTAGADQNPDIPIGAHLVTPRPGYTHHGIYAGEGRVIHYSGLANGLNSGPVEETSIESFTSERDFYIKEHSSPRFSKEEIVLRARSRIGEQLYCVFSNNCEHFCEWVINNDHDSKQVLNGASITAPTTGTLAGLVSRGVVAASGATVGLSGAGVMSGLASVGSLVGGGAVAGIGVLGAGPGVAMASLVNSTILKDSEVHSPEERDSRAVGRVASYAGVAVGTASSIGAVSAAGSVAGLSGAGITSGLAAIGGSVGGGMAAGVAITTAAPVVAAVAAGYGIYKLVKWAKN